MQGLKYTVIESRKQYNQYCDALDGLLELDATTKEQDEEIKMLTLLIQTWDSAHSPFKDLDPIAILRSLMKEHSLGSSDVCKILGISKSYFSEVLHYKKGLSKVVIRKLAAHFKMAQEAFSRPYALKTAAGPSIRQAAKKAASKAKQKGGVHRQQAATKGVKRKLQPA